MQKHKFGIMFPSSLFVESEPVLPKHENSASMFGALEAPEALHDMQIRPDAKTQVRRNCHVAVFV
jgi:hypothetical protein